MHRTASLLMPIRTRASTRTPLRTHDAQPLHIVCSTVECMHCTVRQTPNTLASIQSVLHYNACTQHHTCWSTIGGEPTRRDHPLRQRQKTRATSARSDEPRSIACSPSLHTDHVTTRRHRPASATGVSPECDIRNRVLAHIAHSSDTDRDRDTCDH